MHCAGGQRREVGRPVVAVPLRCFLYSSRAPSAVENSRRDAFKSCCRFQRGWQRLLGRGRLPVAWVRKRQDHVVLPAVARGLLKAPLMTHPIGPNVTFFWMISQGRLARSGPESGALGRQLSALKRRRRLRMQQLLLQTGTVDHRALPSYPFRPRPPS